METLNLIQGNVYEHPNTDSGHGVYNMYTNSLGQLKNILGYKETGTGSISPNKYNAKLKTANEVNLIIADNNGISILEKNPQTNDFTLTTTKLFFVDARNPAYAPTVPWNPNSNRYSFIQDAKGIIYVTDGSIGGLYLLWIPYDSNNKPIVNQIYFQQFPYNLINSTDAAVNLTPVQNGKIVALINPAHLAYLDTHIVCVDDGALPGQQSGTMYIIDNVHLSGNPDSPFSFTAQTNPPLPSTTVTYPISMQSTPCPIVAVYNINSTLYVIGSKGVEQWYSFSGLFPIKRYSDRSISVGTPFRKTIINNDTTIIFLGSNDDRSWAIYVLEGGRQPRIIKKNNISYAFSGVRNFEEITFASFGLHGQEFLIINFNEQNIEHYYSLMIDLESEDSFYLVDEFKGKPSRFLADDIFIFQNKYYFISWNINKLYLFSEDINTFDGRPINCFIRTTQFFAKENKKTAIQNLQIAFAPLENLYYQYYDKHCVPILQDNQKIGYEIEHKNVKGQWVSDKTFRSVNRGAFHAQKSSKIVCTFNPQIKIRFYQSTYLTLGKIIYLPIILNNITIDTEKKF